MENKYAAYREIRYDRTYRTLGRMTWWRIVLGVALLLFVLLMAGSFSQMAAYQGNYVLAEKLMIVPAWMERYKPDTKAFIESGACLERGDFDVSYDKAVAVDPEELSPNDRDAYRSVCEALTDYFNGTGKAENLEKAERLQNILEQLSE